MSALSLFQLGITYKENKSIQGIKIVNLKSKPVLLSKIKYRGNETKTGA